MLVDPFGDHPVLLAGSHNLGTKASHTNDEKLLIIRDAPGLQQLTMRLTQLARSVEGHAACGRPSSSRRDFLNKHP